MNTAVDTSSWVTAYAVTETIANIPANNKHANPVQCRRDQKSAALGAEAGKRQLTMINEP